MTRLDLSSNILCAIGSACVGFPRTLGTYTACTSPPAPAICGNNHQGRAGTRAAQVGVALCLPLTAPQCSCRLSICKSVLFSAGGRGGEREAEKGMRWTPVSAPRSHGDTCSTIVGVTNLNAVDQLLLAAMRSSRYSYMTRLNRGAGVPLGPDPGPGSPGLSFECKFPDCFSASCSLDHWHHELAALRLMLQVL